MRWTALLGAFLAPFSWTAVLSHPSSCRELDMSFRRSMLPRQESNSSSIARTAVSLSSVGIRPGTTRTAEDIAVGFHLDWDSGAEIPQQLSSALGRPLSVVGGFVHVNETSPSWHELDAQLPAILAAKDTTVYSPAILPLFTLDKWTSRHTEGLVSRMVELNEQGVQVWLRFAYEMNADWMPYGQDAAAFLPVFQDVALAVHARAPQTKMLWAPNVALLDAGELAHYWSYYPGSNHVDIAGLSLYHHGAGSVDNDVPSSSSFAEYFDTFYNVYAPSHPIVLAETSAPEHYAVPPYLGGLPFDSEVPGGAAGIQWDTMTRSEGSASSEYERKTTWFELVAGANAKARWPRLTAVLWFNVAKIGGTANNLRLNDNRGPRSTSSAHDGGLTSFFRSRVGNATAHYANELSPTFTVSRASAVTTATTTPRPADGNNKTSAAYLLPTPLAGLAFAAVMAMTLA